MQSRVIPSKIIVGGHDVDVRTGELGKDASGYTILGEWRHKTNTITLSPVDNEDVLWESFWHEAVEAINSTYRLDIPHETIVILGTTLSRVHKDVTHGC